MAERVAREIPPGAYVNLGIGLPELVAAAISPDQDIVFHTENGLLGMGAWPADGGDPDLINAGKKRITSTLGAAYFHHADSFAMIRGGHVDVCILGAMQVSAGGDLANWSAGQATAVPSVGGAMDLVAGVSTVFVLTQHCTKDGTPKLVDQCTYPLTGAAVVTRIFTELAVIAPGPSGFVLIELASGVGFDEVQSRTAAELRRAA